jgi:hypothetical protein
MQDMIKQGFTTPDGSTFDTKAEALNYLRRPKIQEALNVVTANDANVTDWLLNNQEAVEVAFETGTIRRVTKAEHNKLKKAVEHMVALNDPKMAFLADNADAVLDSFRWPSVKRLNPEEKAAAARNTLTAATGGNASLAEWIMTNQEGILAAYQAGVEKREVNPKATEALAAYRAKKAAEKAAAAAAE